MPQIAALVLRRGTADDCAMQPASSGRQRHLGRVLVVDDDASVRRVCTRVLASEGWHVEVAANGEVEEGSAAFRTILDGRGRWWSRSRVAQRLWLPRRRAPGSVGVASSAIRRRLRIRSNVAPRKGRRARRHRSRDTCWTSVRSRRDAFLARGQILRTGTCVPRRTRLRTRPPRGGE